MAKRKPSSSRTRTLRRLRQRLQEAEDTLRAIREGNVDALVVDSPDGGGQLFTLRSADHPYRLIVEQMREGALTVNDQGTILYCNARFAEMIGARPERLAGRTLAACLAPDDRPKAEAMLQADSYRESLSLLTATGAEMPAQASSTALTIDGIRSIAVVVTDLTHELVERGLRESNRLKDEFLATLSHELRTPLNVILGWTRMLLTEQLSVAARRHALQLVERNAQAQAQLVNDLVDMSRMTTGKLTLHLEALPIVPALEAALDSVRPSAQAKQLKLRTAWDALDATVVADATRLQQMLWNLLSNAVKFTPSRGTVSIGATQIDGRIAIEVSDNGIGIERGFLPHVFDRFRQADSGTTRLHGGLGLGLAIVRDLARLHGGDVEVRSEGLSRGATFRVTLPAAAAAPRAASRRVRARSLARLAGHRILVVEDHQDSRGLISFALTRAGAKVIAFERAAPALKALEKLTPSAIVADIGLPGEDGYGFIKRVRRHRAVAVQSVPAIAVTAYATAADRALALEAGYQRQLTKPLELEALVEAIHEIVRGRKNRRQDRAKKV